MKHFIIMVYSIFILFNKNPRDITITYQTQKTLPNSLIHKTYIVIEKQDDLEIFHGYYSFPNLPQTFHDAQSINSFYQTQFEKEYNKMKVLRNAAHQNILPLNTVYAYDHTFEVTFLSKHFLSILENTYTYAGGAHPDITNEAHTFSLQTGKEINLADLFLLSDIETDDYIKKFIINEIHKNPDEYFPDAIETLQNTPLDKFKFYINKYGIRIFFNPDEISPYVNGIVEFSIPI